MAERKLKIARDLALPLDMVTEATAVVATRGAGKSSAGAVFVEESFAAGVQSVVLDWTGVFWGLRSSADGTGPGLPIYVFGGQHGDLPLEAAAGKLMADLVVDSGHSFVFDLSDLSKEGKRHFCAEFLDRLYDRKARARTTLLLVVDEAHELAPQTPRGGFKGWSATLMGAIESVVSNGRHRGIGVLMITQRTQALNKAVLDLIEQLLVMRMLSPRSHKAIREWIVAKDEEDEAGVIASLPDLPTGTAWVWAPLRGVLKKVAIRRITTFDSYKTPKPGEVLIEPKQRRTLDLEALGEQMAATIEKAKADDPAELRKQIRDLKKQLAERPATEERVETVEVEVPVEMLVEVPVITPEQLAELTAASEALQAHVAGVQQTAEGLLAAGEHALEAARLISTTVQGAADGHADGSRRAGGTAADREAARERPGRVPPGRPAPAARRAPAAADTGRRAREGAAGNGSTRSPDLDNWPTGPQQKILDALAWWEAVGVTAPTRGQLAFVAGYSHSQSRGFRDPLYGLNALGLIAYPEAKRVALTEAGARSAAHPAQDPSEEELQQRIYELVGTNRAKMLRELIARHPHEVTRDELAAELGYSHSQSRGFRDPLYRLHSLELVEYPGPGTVRASELCFL